MSESVSKTPGASDGGSKLPARIGRYEITEKLGSGSTGTVYRATDPFIGRALAIKTFRVDLQPGPLRDRFLQRFYHEARISGGLSHPNIVALFDVGEVEGLPYLVFEHVEGPTLDVALARSGRLDSAETIRVVEQAASALDFAHAKGVVHRDIRPANIILATDKRVRIADFGIARIEGSQLTQHGEVLGTPAYMSPEQIRGQELSPESDLFSLAVCAYEMLTGARPFAGKTQSEMLEALVYSPPAEPKELRQLGIPSRDFMFVFERALAKDPSHRFADGASFARALKSCLGVVVPGEDQAPVSRIAIPEPLPKASRAILPPVAPKPQAPPAAPVLPAPPAAAKPQAPARPAASTMDTGATQAIEGATRAAPKPSASADATLISQGPGAKAAVETPADTSDEALIETVGFGQGLNARKLDISAEATMLSPSAAEQRAIEGQQRLSREAVESLVSRSSPGTPAPPLQKTLPGSDRPPASEPSALEDLLPPTREMPKLKMPGPAADPNRTSSQAPGALKLTPSPAEKTVIMTESEKQTAARLRDRSASQLKATSSMPQIAAPPPPPPPTRPLPRPVTARVTLPPPPPPTLAAPRPSILPKVLLGVFVFLGLLGIGLGVLFFAKPRGSEAPQAETWNNLPVYPEADVDKSPLLFSHEVPKPKLEPGRVVSVTVSWIVTPEGLVDDPRIETSASPEIDAFVVEAVKKWRYEPGQKAGKTVPVRVLRKYTFGQRTSSQNP